MQTPRFIRCNAVPLGGVLLIRPTVGFGVIQGGIVVPTAQGACLPRRWWWSWLGLKLAAVEDRCLAVHRGQHTLCGCVMRPFSRFTATSSGQTK